MKSSKKCIVTVQSINMLSVIMLSGTAPMKMLTVILVKMSLNLTTLRLNNELS
jgi:hypothetical protein